MEIVALKDRPDLKALINAVDPKFRKQKVFLNTGVTKVTLAGTYWDGGTIDHYFLVNVATKKVVPLAGVAPPQFGGPRVPPEMPLLEGSAIVRTGVFCGKPSTPSIYLP